MRTGWKIAIGLAATVAFVSAGTAFLGLVVLPWKFNPEPPVVAYAKPTDALQAQRQDIDYFGRLTALDRSFSRAARAEADRRLAILKALDKPLGPARLRVALLATTALADNGHTRLGASADQPPPELPVRASLFADGIFVMRVHDKDADVLGARVEAIDGTPIARVMGWLMSLRGGTQAWRQVEAMQFLYQQDILHAAGIARDADGATWTLRLPSGETVERRFTAYRPAKDEPTKRSTRWLDAAPLKGLDKGWKSLRPASHAVPVAFQSFDTAFRRVHVPDSCVVYLQLKGISDVGDEHIQDFLAASEADLSAHKACTAIVDLRFNTGGDYTNAHGFAGKLPQLVSGAIYVLTSPQTFSAAITTTAFLKQAAPARVHILGEEVGDRMPFFAEGNRGCLPNYHLCLGYQTGMHDYVHPCTNPDVCYWLNYIYPARIPTFVPEETIHTRFADWNAGHDPVFARAVALSSRK